MICHKAKMIIFLTVKLIKKYQNNLQQTLITYLHFLFPFSLKEKLNLLIKIIL